MIIRFGFLAAASVAAYAVKQIIFSTFLKPPGTGDEREKTELKNNTEKEEEESILLLTESMDSVNFKDVQTYFAPSIFNTDDKEVQCLRSMINEMEEMQENHRTKLLVYYGLKEQEQEIFELKNSLQMITTEINKLNLRVDTLKTENQTLQEESMHCILIKKQLEKATVKINELQQQIRMIAEQRKRQMMMLKEQLETLQVDDKLRSDAEIQKKLEKGNDLQLEAMKLRRRQRELQLENRVLAIKMVVVEARATAIYNTTESEVLKSIRVQADASRLENENLLKQVDSLQKDRFHAVEELVYQRWVNSCLRHETQSYQTPRSKTSISDSHRTSTESNVYDPLADNSSTKKTRISRRTRLIQKMKSWRRSIATFSVGSSLTSSSESSNRRRSSFSIGSSASKYSHGRDLVTSLENSSDSPGVAEIPYRRRRVSFNDSLNTTRTLPEYPTETERPIKDSDVVNTDWSSDCPDSASTSDTGEPLFSQLMPNSSEKNIAGSDKIVPHVESEIHQPADHTEISVQPRVAQSDSIFLLFVAAVIILYLLLHIIRVF